MPADGRWDFNSAFEGLIFKTINTNIMCQFIGNEIAIPYNIVHNDDVIFVLCFSHTNLPVSTELHTPEAFKTFKKKKNL